MLLFFVVLDVGLEFFLELDLGGFLEEFLFDGDCLFLCEFLLFEDLRDKF